MAKVKIKKPGGEKRPATPRATPQVSTQRARLTKFRRDSWTSLLLGFGAITSLISIIAVYLAFEAIAVAHTVKLSGRLQAIEQATPVKHQTGGVVNEIFVTEGELVRQGQILLSLGTEDLDDAYFNAQKTVAHLLVNLNCIKSLKNSAKSLVLTQDMKTALARLNQLPELRRATRNCNARLHAQSYKTATDQANRLALVDEVSLLGRLAQSDFDMRLAVKNGSETNRDRANDKVARLSEMRRSLEHSLDAARAQARLDALTRELQKQKVEQQVQFDRDTDAITDALVKSEQELARITTLRSNRFLYASVTGRIQRLRIKKTGGRIAAGAYVLEIAPLTTDFEVLANVGIIQMPDVMLGHPVQVRLAGNKSRPIWVPARVETITKLSANKQLISVRLKREDLNKRDLLYGDNSLNGLGEQAEALVSISSETAGRSLKNILSGHLRRWQISEVTL